MATLTERIQQLPVDDLAAEAGESHPGRAVATAITAVFVAIGWVIGSVWFALSYCLAAARYGYRQGAHVRRAPSQPVRAEELSKL